MVELRPLSQTMFRREILRRLILGGPLLAINCGRERVSCSRVEEVKRASPKPPAFNQELSRYLEGQPKVRQAIIFIDGRKYDEWEPEVKTKLFDFYVALESNRPLPLSFSGTPPLEAPYKLKSSIAEEIYLGYVAHSLWVELKRKVPWHLHDYDSDSLQLLLSGKNMFVDYIDVCKPNSDSIGYVTPSNPTPAYNFMINNPEEGNLVKSTPRLTIYALTRWMLKHLVHRRLECGEGIGRMVEGEVSDPEARKKHRYGYDSYVITEMMIARKPHPPLSCGPKTEGLGLHYWSPDGCHSSTGLMVMALRTVNIPAVNLDSLPTITSVIFPSGVSLERRVYHSGVAFPAEGLYLEHTDNITNIYDEPEKGWSNGFPFLDPAAAYISKDEFERDFGPRADTFISERKYLRRLLSIGAMQPTYPFLRAYHKGGRRKLREILRLYQDSKLFSAQEVDEIIEKLKCTIRSYGGFARIKAEYQRLNRLR